MIGAVAVIAFAFGAWFTNLCWEVKVLQKARDGHRLEVDGRLFDVAEAEG